MLNSLTEPQRTAATTINGPLLILAGPGSGKTRVVTHRTAYMVEQGINPRRILTLTFTNKAADEMQTRLNRLVADSSVWTSTFHKFCSKTLREYGSYAGLEENFTIYDTTDSKKALKQAIEENKVDLYKYAESQILTKISDLKNQLITYEDFEARPGAPLDAIVQKLYPLYQKRLIRSNAVDFDDLLLHVAKLLSSNPDVREDLDARYEYISVDEYQDTNYAQYMILKMLSVNHRNLAVTGDPDQSIYGWRGANIRNILDFEKDFPETKVVKLEQNYRSTPQILEVADQLISYNTQRKEKQLFTENKSGIPVRLVAFPNQIEEANKIADQIHERIRQGTNPKDIAIFYRTNALSRTLEHSLRTLSIPYQIVKGHEFYQRKEVKDILAYLHLINNPRNDVAFDRIINVPTRKIGKVTIDRIKDYAYQYGICLLEAALNADKISTLKGVAKKNIQKFADMMLRLRESATDLVGSIIKKVYVETGYQETLLMTGNPEDEERADNLDELLNAAMEFDREYKDFGGLDVYLDQASLVNDQDAWDGDTDKVTLMTLHAAKGLEFPIVYIVALEDQILPHARSMESDSEIEEERRLFFVGITRAMSELQISRAMYRTKKGSMWPTIPSTFLMELPREKMEVHEPQRHTLQSEFLEPSDDDHFGDSEYEEPVFDVGEPVSQEDDTNDMVPHHPAVSDSGDDVPFDVFVDDQSTGEVESEPKELNTSKEVLATQSPPEESGFAVPEIKTAAQMLGGDDLDDAALSDKAQTADGSDTGGTQVVKEKRVRHPASTFKENMLVSHPNYGMGRILSISRAGSKQTASVDFVSIGQKKFVLDFCPLQPLVDEG